MVATIDSCRSSGVLANVKVFPVCSLIMENLNYMHCNMYVMITKIYNMYMYIRKLEVMYITF